MKKIVIIGTAFAGNKGAAAMLESSIQTLTKRFPDAQFTLLAMYPTEDKKLNPYKNLTILKGSAAYLGVVINSMALLYRIAPFLRSWIKRKCPEVKALAEADVLLDQGGITFVDGREVFLIYNVATILPALNVKTPVVKCAQALGPFNKFINRTVSKIFLPKMAKIVSRGAITHKYLEGLGLKNVVAGADYAFSLELTKEDIASAKKKINDAFFAKNDVVGVSPSVVMKKKMAKKDGDYVKEMVDFINYLIDEKGHKVTIIPHSYRAVVTSSQHNNDMPLCKEIYEQINNKEQCLLIDVDLSSQELRYVIGRCNLFVASRFHAMVSSLAMSIPTLVIGWNHKYREVLEMFELEEWAFGQDKFTQPYIKKRFAELEDKQQEIRKKLKQHLPEVKKKSLKQVDVIAEVIEGN